MKSQHSVSLLVVASAFLVPAAASAQQSDTNDLNRFSFSARFGFNINARFKNIGAVSLPTRRTPTGDNYNYYDGYVLKDISGDAVDPGNPGFGPITTYWGYDNSSKQVGSYPAVPFGQTITMHRDSVAATGGGADSEGTGLDEDDVNFGGELVYNRELGTQGNLHYGVELAANYLDISMEENSSVSGDVTQTADTYRLEPGTQAPLTPPLYQGSFTGPGVVLSSVPSSTSSTLFPGGTTIMSHGNFDANLWGFRLGPYIEFPLRDKLNLSASGGLAVGLLDGSASWTSSAVIPGVGTATGSGNDSDLDVLWGYYVRANLEWQFSERWNAEAGVQYQDLGVYNHDYSGRTVQLDLSKSIFVTVGIGYRF